MITKPKGTYDLYGKKGKETVELRNFIEELMDKFNYEYIKTPIFESSELFHRGVGDTTDIVTKETYDFIDRGNRSMTLRPEGTAGVIRSYIENKMSNEANIPKKFWYFGPMYRYERPQSGRYREFQQFGIEALGSDDPMLDAEVISVAVNLFNMLGLKGIKVNINTLGDNDSRELYRNALLEYLKPHIDTLCDDCKKRYEKNPLRILDCKVDGDNELLKNVPKTIEYLNESSKEHFEKVLKYLDTLGIEYNIDTSIVRGLDYYTHTVFEIEASVEGFGSQNVMCGGGRYDNLAKTLGGPETPGVGFAIGIERLLTALEFENITLVDESSIDCYIMPMGEEQKEFSFALLNAFRILGIKSDIDYLNRSIKSNFKQAERLNAKFAIIIGEKELEENYLTVKNMETKKEEQVANEMIITYLFDSLMDIEDDCECGCSNDHECDCDDCDCDK